MTVRAVVDVHVTDHARDRARERCPGFKAARIVDEVRAALNEGRISPHRPAWAKGRDPDCLYTWTPDELRCYPIKALVNGFLVLTTIVREEA